MIVQFLPQAPERMRPADLPGDGDYEGEFAHREDDNWAEARMMADTIDGDEMTDPLIGAERLLYRLFHERGVRVYEPHPCLIGAAAHATRSRASCLGFSAEEISASTEDGTVSVTCEFCSTTYKMSRKS